MIAKFTGLADSIIAMPHSESLEMKGNISDREWAWCDALFMAPPSLAALYHATGNIKYLNIMDRLWWKTTDYLYDSTEHLYYRDSRYFTQKEKNGNKVFWSRGNGWVIAGLVRILDDMPKDYPSRSRYESLFKNMAEKIASLQTADGTWHASLLDPDVYDVKETSGTGFYCYALTWGVNHGYLSQKTYLPVIQKAWDALNSCVHADGMLGFVQPIGAAPDSVNGNDTEAYGAGAFLLAGTQIYLLETGNKAEQ